MGVLSVLGWKRADDIKPSSMCNAILILMMPHFFCIWLWKNAVPKTKKKPFRTIISLMEVSIYKCDKTVGWTKAQEIFKKICIYLHPNRTTGIPIDLLTVRLIVAAKRGIRIRIRKRINGKWGKERKRAER